MFLLNKKVISVFKLDFAAQIIYCIIHRCLYSLFILFKQDMARILTLPYS